MKLTYLIEVERVSIYNNTSSIPALRRTIKTLTLDGNTIRIDGILMGVSGDLMASLTGNVASVRFRRLAGTKRRTIYQLVSVIKKPA